MLVNQIVFEEPLISENRKPQLKRLVYKLIEKLETNESDDFYLFKVDVSDSETRARTRGGMLLQGTGAAKLVFCLPPC